MPDGFGGVPEKEGARDVKPAGAVKRVNDFLFGSRNRALIVWAIVAALGLAAAGAYVQFKPLPPTLSRPDAYAYLTAASCLVWLPLLALLLDPSANLASGPRIRLPVVSVVILATLAAIAVADHYDVPGVYLESTASRIAFFSFLATVFVVRVWNAANFARHKERNRRLAAQVAQTQARADAIAGRPETSVAQQIAQHRDAESLGALLATLFVVVIVVGAYLVGGVAGTPKLSASLGVGIFVTVVCVFAVVVFLDPIADLPVVRGCATAFTHTARGVSFLAAFYNWVDSGLVFIGAHVAGADHREWQSRYAVLGGALVCLAVMAWFLQPPWGLAPMGLGLVVALSVSRLWSWVEEDRNIASITKFNPLAPQRVGFREDFRDETILGFLFVLILIPIGMMQAHQSRVFGDYLFRSADKSVLPVIDPNNWQMWLGYFGFELAKALPIVDWADIYGLGPGSDSIEPTHPIGQHAVFMARATVDLILIAALLQAIGIASRNRQQKALYAADQINRLDELVEKVELKKAVAAADCGEGAYDLSEPASRGLIDFRRYDDDRLRQLYAISNEQSKRRAFISKIFEQSGRRPDPLIVVVQNIAASGRNELDLIQTFARAKLDHERGVHTIDMSDLRTILFELRGTSGMKEFKQELIRTAITLNAPNELLEMLRDVAVGPQRDQFQYARLAAATAMIERAHEFNSADEIIETLALLEKNREPAFGAQRQIGVGAEEALKVRLKTLQESRRDE